MIKVITYGRYMMSLDTIGFNKMKMIQIKWNEETHKIIDDNKVITPTFIEEDYIKAQIFINYL